MAFFIAIFAAFSYAYGYLTGGSSQSGIFSMVPALLFSGMTSVGSYFFSDKIVLKMHNAKEIKDRFGEEGKQIVSMTHNLCKVAGLPPCKVYLIDSPALNAFATGRNPKNAVVAVTSGLVNKLNKAELEGVLAHEVAHIKNFDIRLMTITAVLVGSIALVADWGMRSMYFRGDEEGRKNGGIITLAIFILAMILTPIIARLISLAVSRQREYLADATGAYLTRYPKGLADALKKISGSTTQFESANRATAHMFISNPFKKQKSISALFSTHPPAQERIKRLTNMT